MVNNIQFIPYKPQFKQDFIDLNIDWLEEFFEVEPYDKKVLEDCENQILAKGGFIFFALLDAEVVGTFAYIKMNDQTFELSKMAVAKSHRGKGIGNLMMAFSIRFAEQHHWKNLVLYSSTTLDNSLHLYRKYGYMQIPLEPDCPYKRGDIKMELRLG
ncbi:MAG: GNAT family N-acetyltransferase [Flavobacteriaceae bacterium]